MSYQLNTHICLFLACMLFVTCCNGQVGANSAAGIDVDAHKQPKMIKKQGIYSYATYTGPRTNTNISINSILEDKGGNIWLATLGEGVYCYNGKTFTNFTVKDGLITNLVYSILEDKEGNIWFGTVGGASCYNGKTFTSFPFRMIQGNSAPLSETNTAQLQPEVWSMVQDKTGNIWFGTTEGVYSYNGRIFKNILEAVSVNTGSLNLKTVSSIIEDRKGNIWFTSWSAGLCRFDGESIRSFKTEVSADLNLLETKNGTIWISRRGNGGIYSYNGKEFKSALPGIKINSMKEDTRGNIWFCTFPTDKTSGGIICYNPATSEIISHSTTAEGLSNSAVASVAIGRSGNIWFGTYGMNLNKYDGKTFTRFFSE